MRAWAKFLARSAPNNSNDGVALSASTQSFKWFWNPFLAASRAIICPPAFRDSNAKVKTKTLSFTRALSCHSICQNALTRRSLSVCMIFSPLSSSWASKSRKLPPPPAAAAEKVPEIWHSTRATAKARSSGRSGLLGLETSHFSICNQNRNSVTRLLKNHKFCNHYNGSHNIWLHFKNLTMFPYKQSKIFSTTRSNTSGMKWKVIMRIGSTCLILFKQQEYSRRRYRKFKNLIEFATI